MWGSGVGGGDRGVGCWLSPYQGLRMKEVQVQGVGRAHVLPFRPEPCALPSCQQGVPLFQRPLEFPGLTAFEPGTGRCSPADVNSGFAFCPLSLLPSVNYVSSLEVPHKTPSSGLVGHSCAAIASLVLECSSCRETQKPRMGLHRAHLGHLRVLSSLMSNDFICKVPSQWNRNP